MYGCVSARTRWCCGLTDGKPYCNEFGLVVENYDQAKVKAELDRRGIASKPNPAGGLLLKDPNGLEIGIAGKA